MEGSAPFVTGNDLLAYQGNANLGYGGGTNYLYNPAIANPLQTFDNTLSQAAQNAQRMNEMVFEAKRREREMRYEQNVKERNAMLDMIHSTGQSIFNQKDAQGNNMSYTMLPEDYNQLSELNGQIAKEIAANPATANFAYTPEIREKYAQWRQLNNMAQQKAFMAQQTRMQLAQETDPEERQKIAEHLKSIEETPLNSFKHIEPYVSPMRYSYANVWDPKMYDKERQTELKKVYEKDDAGNLVEKTLIGVSPSFGDFREKMKVDRSYANIINKMVEARLPTLSDAQIQHYDHLAVEANEARELYQGDVGYVPKLSDALQSGNKEDIAYSLLGSPIMSTFEKRLPKKSADELAYQQAQTNKITDDELDIESKKADIAFKKAQIKQMEEGKTTPLTPAQKAMQTAASNTVKRAWRIYNPALYDQTKSPGTPIVPQTTIEKHLLGNKKIEGFKPIDGVDVGSLLKEEGINPTEWVVYKGVNGSEEGVGKQRVTIGATANGQENGKEYKTGENEKVDKTFTIYNPNTKEVKVAYFQKDGDKYKLLNVVGERDYLSNVSSGKHKWASTGKEAENMAQETTYAQDLWDAGINAVSANNAPPQKKDQSIQQARPSTVPAKATYGVLKDKSGKEVRDDAGHPVFVYVDGENYWTSTGEKI